MPATRTFIAALCAVAAGGAALTGCGGDKGDDAAPLMKPVVTTSAPTKAADPFADQTADEVLKRAEQDMRDSGAMTYELSGSDEDSGQMHIKGTLTTTDKCALAVDMGEGKVQLIFTGGDYTYMKGDNTFWTTNADAESARVIGDKWVKIPSAEFDSDDEDNFKTMCDLNGMMDTLSEDDGDDSSRLDKGRTATVGGQQVFQLIETDGADKTTISVTTGDNPVILRAEGTNEGQPMLMVFSDFGKQPNVTAPPPSMTLDPSKVGGPGGLHI
ncbi:hypothetical protein [Streptomyces sp. NPDC021020]|uniref:hypothetical protein n=1 Tax=Streptomyces sp. NPDC021020 TaxID=3365109 RepID=UPI0037A14A2C